MHVLFTYMCTYMYVEFNLILINWIFNKILFIGSGVRWKNIVSFREALTLLKNGFCFCIPQFRDTLLSIIIQSIFSFPLEEKINEHSPSSGYVIEYSALHWGHMTLAMLLPRCFSSIQRCKHIWWTHLVVPLQRHGLTHSADRSSSIVAKQTQQVLLQTMVAVIRKRSNGLLTYGQFTARSF